MSFAKISGLVVAGLLVVLPATQTKAGTVTFNDLGAWVAALGGAPQVLENFNGPSTLDLNNNSQTLGDLTVSGNNFASGSTAVINNAFSSGFVDIGSFTTSDIVTFSVSPPIFAFGFIYDPGDAGGDRIRVRLDGDDLAVLDNQLGDPNAFFGVIDDTGAAIGDLSITSAISNGMFAEIESVRWAEVAAVPAPAPVFLFLTGLGALRWVTRRRRRTA